jgi:uncharacterized protein YlxP (DUF503 family)
MAGEAVIVAIQTWELHLEGCHSLKDKRSVLAPIKQSLRKQLNVAVAETDHQDLWQRAMIACASVGSDRGVVEQTFRSADAIVEGADGVRIIDTVMAFL